MAQVVADFTVYNSIINNLNDEKLDSRAPFTLIEFLNYKGVLEKDAEEIELYGNYLKKWQSASTITEKSVNADIKTQFISFLSEIKILYTSTEEKRFLENIDLNNDEHLSIAIPFFAKKIKEISQYFAKKRKEITRDIDYVKRKGSNDGFKEAIRRELLNIFNSDEAEGLVKPLDIGAFVDGLGIEVENKYDTFNDYYDLDPTKPSSFYDSIEGQRSDFYTSNTNILSGNFYYDTEAAIRDIINERGIVLKEIPGLLVDYDTTDISNLDETAFQDYNQNAERSNLRYLLQAELVQKFMGTDMYYLSTNTLKESVSGKVFNASAPYKNLLNINNASTLTVPGNDFKTERQVGLFYGPAYQGIVKVDAAFTPVLDKRNLKSDTTYIFPDPNRYGNIDGVGGSRRETPFVFVLDNSEYKNSTSSFGEGLVKSDNDNQNFYSYSSVEQDNYNKDNIKPLAGLEAISLSGNILKEQGDIFGNIYYTINPVANGRNLKAFTPLQVHFNRETTFDTVSERFRETINEKRHKKKDILVYNLIKDKIENITTSFKPIFEKYTYNTELYNELTTNIIDIDIFKETVYIKTPSYLVTDNIALNTDGTFRSKIFISRVKKYNSKITTEQNIREISNFSNPVQIGNNVFTVKLQSEIASKPTNLRTYNIEVYRLDINRQVEKNIIDVSTVNRSFFDANLTFDTGTNFVQVKNVKLAFNKKQDRFFLLSDLVDLNNSHSLHTLIFSIKGNNLTVHENYVITPDNYNVTENFYKSNVLSQGFKTQTLSSTPTQITRNGTFNF